MRNLTALSVALVQSRRRFVPAPASAPPPAPGGEPVLSSLSSYGVQAGATGFTLTATGSGITAGDQIEVWGTLRTTTIISGTSASCPVDTGDLVARNFGCVRLARGTDRSFALPFEVYDTATYTNNYVTNSATVIGLTYGTAPTKGETRTLDTTGTPIVRETNIADQSGVTQYTGTYSRFPNTSADGAWLLADRETSTQCDLVRRSDRVNLGPVRDGAGTGVGNNIGEFHEPRWDTLGNRPGVIYYMRGMRFCERDIIAGTAEVTIRDFTADFGSGYLMNDVEGICSIDCRYWVWMHRTAALAPGIYRFVRYDKLKNTFTTATNTTIGVSLSSGTFTRPNMCESSLRGDRIITGYDRVYPGNRDSEFGTFADMVYSWAVDWTDPKNIAVDATHSGQAFDANMRQLFLSQNNRTDEIEWCDTINGGTFRTGSTVGTQNTSIPANLGTNGRFQLASQSTDSGGYAINVGYHISVSMSGVRRGFCHFGTYSDEGYRGSQTLRMVRLTDARTWRIGHKPGVYPSGDAYRNEAQPALSHDCTEIIMGGNWNDLFSSGHREVFIAYLPRDWHTNAIWT